MGNSSSNSLSPQEAKKLIKDNSFDVILDVRTDNEWNEGHYYSAVHLPLNTVEKNFQNLYPNKSTKVLVYCRSGVRAENAKQILNSQGYMNVYSVNGGGYSDII